MCVWIISEKGVNPPTDNELKLMWDKNPDGAGMVWCLDNGLIEYHKGFMTWNSFIKKWHVYKKKYDMKDRAVGFHFRIKTHGNIDKGTCHPFRLTSHYKKLRQTDYIGSQPVIMHNGVLSNFGGWIDKNSSDTQDFVATVGVSMLAKPSKTKIKAAKLLLGQSKIAIFYGDNKIVTIGDTEEHNGMTCSNLRWKPLSQSEIKKEIDPMYLTGKNWIEFTTEEKKKTRFSMAKLKVDKWGKYYETQSNVCWYENPENPLELFTIEGEQCRMSNDIDEDPEDETLIYGNYYEDSIYYETLMEEIEVKDGKPYIDGERVYIDIVSKEIFNETALKLEFPGYWRQVRKDIEEHDQMLYDWTNDPENEKKAMQRDLAKKHKATEGGICGY